MSIFMIQNVLAFPGLSLMIRRNSRVRSTYPRVGSNQRQKSIKRSYMPSYQPLADMARVSMPFLEKLSESFRLTVLAP